MKTQNEMKLTFPSYSVNEAFARTAVAAFFAQLDPTLDEIGDMKTAVSEAVTNCIVHAYRNTIGPVCITARVLEGDEAYIKVKDRGCGIENVKQAMEPMFTTAPEEERAGLGFAVMESFMDSVKVTSKVGKGTAVVLRKKLASRANHG